MLLADSSVSAGAAIAVELSGISRVFDGGVAALNGISLRVPPGQFLSVLGPSGCGKSTLLRLIAGLDQPQAGQIALRDSTGADAWRDRIAYVFQDAHLLPWRTVLRNVALPLELKGVARKTRSQVSAAALAQVGLADLVDRYPNQLSGGQRMRVSLARAMVTEPRLLLLDEPFAALDEITRQRLDEQLRALWLARKMTVIFVTHSTQEAVFLSERAIVMSPRPGRVIADQAIDLPTIRPGSLRGSPGFAAQMRILFEALEGGGA